MIQRCTRGRGAHLSLVELLGKVRCSSLARCYSRFQEGNVLIGLEPIGAGTTAGAQVAVTAGVVDSFMVGGARIDSLAVVIADFFAALSEAVGAKLDGIVGYNFLRNYKVVLDYPNERVTLL